MGRPHAALLGADFPQMNFTQMHEYLRLELQRRIQRGSLSVSLLARQTGYGQAHLSNFLRSQRQLSLEAMDRILAAQHMTTADLQPLRARRNAADSPRESSMVPIVSHNTALFEPIVRPGVQQGLLHLPGGALRAVSARRAHSRRTWQRFVAVRATAADAAAMEPLLMPDAVVLLDRHYNSLVAYRPNRPNLYAVRHGAHLTLRYADFAANRLVLRPHNIGYPVELIDLDPGEAPNDLLTGRVVLILNEL